MDCTGGGYQSNCYMHVTGTFVAGTDNYGFGVNTSLNPSWNATDLSQYDGIFFYYKGDGNNCRLIMNQSNFIHANNYDYFGADFTVNTYWSYYQFPFVSLTQGGWGPKETWDVTKIQAVSLQPAFSVRNVSIGVDNIGFYRNTPTPVVTAPDLKHVQAWPSLCNMKDGCKGIKFTNLTKHTILKIFNLNGGMIYKTEQDTPDGTLFWNLDVNKREKKTAPGFYIYNIIDENKGSVTGKAAIVR
jgi:hypothetical protein